MKKTIKPPLLFLMKAAAILSIFAFLFYQACQNDNDALTQFWQHPKNWGYLALAFLANMTALTITFIRWQFLLKSVGVPLKLREALRIGFLSFLFNLAPVGIVTGDGIRFYMLFHRFPADRARSFAGIVMDRAIGLYVMFLIAVIAIFATGYHAYTGSPENMAFMATIVRSMLALLGVSTVVACLVLLPDLTRGVGARLLDRCCGRIPKLKSAILAIQGYRNHKRALVTAGVMTFAVHGLFSLGIWLIALGFYGYAPTAAEHLVLHPVANVTQLIPLAAGPYEMVLDTMYTLFPIVGHETYRPGYGFLIALGYRFISLLLGGIGILYYLLDRNELRNAVIQESQE